MMKPLYLAVALALLSSACRQVNNCSPGTLFVNVRLDAAATSADNLIVTVDVAGSLKHGIPVKHQPGTTAGSIEVRFAGGYPAGQLATVSVAAALGTEVLARGAQALTLGGSCQAVAIHVSSSDLDGGVDGGRSGCMLDGECPSGHCVDHVCCDLACQGQCEACDLPGSVGICTPVTGQPHGARTPCASASDVCAGRCDGENRSGCAYPGATTQCQSQQCAGGLKVLATNCDGAGNCPVPSPLQCTPAECNSASSDCLSTCTSDAGCASIAGKPYCDHGVCTANKPNGRSCSSSSECTNGNCVDGVCCDQPCSGQCQACDVAGFVGTCTPLTSGQPHGTRAACTGGSTTCGGACAAGQTQVCTYPVAQCAGGTCTSGLVTPAVFCADGTCPSTNRTQCPGNFACNAGGSDCIKAPCAIDGDCLAGSFCSTGGTCVAQHQKGDACDLAADCKMQSCRECATGNCVDGYCCDTPCTDQCAACNVNNGTYKPGTCAPTPSGNQPLSPRAGCSGSGSCKGSCDGTTTTMCAFPTTQCTPQTCAGGVVTFATACKSGSCVAPNPTMQSCTSGQCDSTVTNTCKSGCTSDAQCGASQYCNAAGICATGLSQGSTCHLLANGTNSACYNSGNCAECASGLACADGVCCDSACTGQCQACNAQGQCKTILSGQPISDATTTRAACPGSGNCQEACNGSSPTACADVNGGVSCVAAACAFNSSTGTYQSTALETCSAGSCPPAPAPTDCGGYVCNGAVCYTSCTSDAECLGGFYCASTGGPSGVCVAQIAPGGSCAANPCFGGSGCAQCTGNNVCSRDGTCCNTSCTGACDTCVGTAGVCTHTTTPTPSTACNRSFGCGGVCDGTSSSCNFTESTGNRCNYCGTCSAGVCTGGGGMTCGSFTHCCCGCTRSGTSLVCATCPP
jgi:hypothetical protein